MAQALRYRVHELDPFQFEQLCQSLLKACVDPRIESWGQRSDWGRDAYHQGNLQLPGRATAEEGPFLFQVKFVEGADLASPPANNNLLAAFKRECAAIAEGYERRQVAALKHFVLVTNAVPTAEVRSDLHAALEKVAPHLQLTIWGGSDLCDFIDQHPVIKQAFPVLLGYRDLAYLVKHEVNAELRNRSQLDLEAWERTSSLFVQTSTARQALDWLEHKHFLVLAGPPEAGKSFLARSLALATGWHYFFCHAPGEVLQVYDREASQVFVVDDAFGSTSVDAAAAKAWGKQLQHAVSVVDGKHWLIMTSRSAILRATLAATEFTGDLEQRLQASVLDLSGRDDQAENLDILMSHARAASLPPHCVDMLFERALMLAASPYFTPERARRVVKTLTELPESAERGQALLSELERPTDKMRKIFKALPESQQALLFIMLDEEDVEMRVDRLQARLPAFGWIPEEATLEECLLRLNHQYLAVSTDARGAISTPYFGWSHPSWRDTLIELLAGSPGQRKWFLSSCSYAGWELALSTNGGAEGKRHLPLLLDQGDWELAHACFERLLDDATAETFIAMIEVLDVAVMTTIRQQLPQRQTLKGYATRCMERLVHRMEEQEALVTLEFIELFTDLRARLGASTRLPDLEPTRQHIKWRAMLELSAWEDDGSLDFGWLKAWFEFEANIGHRVPDLEPPLDLDQEERERLSSFFTQAAERLQQELELEPYDSRPEFRSATSALMSIAKFAQRPAWAFLSEDGETLQDDIFEAHASVSEDAHEEWREREIDREAERQLEAYSFQELKQKLDSQRPWFEPTH